MLTFNRLFFNRRCRIGWLFLIMTMLTACGWRLRGITPLPETFLDMVYESNGSAYFNQVLEQQLRFSGVTLHEENTDAAVILKVESVDISKRTVAVSSSGQIAEFELNAELIARLVIMASGNERLINIEGRRLVNNDVNNVLATQTEETLQRQDLEADLASKLMRRLQSIEIPPLQTSNSMR